MLRGLKKHALFITLVAFLAGWTVFLLFIGPAKLVSFIGPQNTYMAAFLIATFGGLSTITGVSFFTAIATFAAGGSSPLLLGLFGGLGIFISDSIFFLIAQRGVKEFKGNVSKISSFIIRQFERLPAFVFYLLIYLYMGFAPLPSDLLMIALAFTRISYKRLAPLILLGGITLATITALLGEKFL